MREITHRLKAGFTLIELMVSVVILSLMMLTLAGMMDLVTKTWVANLGMIDNFTKARTILSLLDRDVQSMVMRPDLAAFVDNNGEPACAFYTRIPGNQNTNSPDTRMVSLVQYLLATSATPPVFERLDYGINFPPLAPQTTPVGLTLSINKLNLPDLANVSASTQTEILSSGVLMFQIQFLNGTGAIITPTSTTPFSFNYTQPGASSNPRIVIVSMLVLNDSAYNLASQTNTLTPLLALFPAGSLPANETYSKYWNGILNSAGFGAALPAPIRRGVRVFERHIPLPLTTSSS